MAKGFGQTTYGGSAGGAYLSANGQPEHAPVGITLDWDTVPENAGGVTLDDGQLIEAGVKFIPFGCVIAKITADGTYGPHQAGDTEDGRETLTRGSCFLVNQTIREDMVESQYGPGFIDGGRVYSTRLKKLNDAGTAYVAHAVDSTFNVAFPRVKFAEHS